MNAISVTRLCRLIGWNPVLKLNVQSLSPLAASAHQAAAPCAFQVHRIQQLLTSATQFKAYKKSEKEKQLIREEPLKSDNLLLKSAYKEMAELESHLKDALDRHFSLKTDLKSYEELLVKMKDGKTYPINHLARVNMLNPQMIRLDFVQNPAAIGPAKDAILRSPLNVNPQQEGAVLHIAIPRMTKERRESIAWDAKHKVLNEYKDGLNKIYTRYDKQNQKETKSQDQRMDLQGKLLAQKKIYEHNGLVMVQQRCDQLFKEVA
ncbi:Ribosome recycling factor [Aphelenchoides besseyi]|nr:Ribosome recycling factor [Aphelenchoides besseyi]